MRKLLILLLGAILIGILSYFCFLDKAGGIKDDLVSKAQSAYAQKQMNWVNTDIKGQGLRVTRILTLDGIAPSEEFKAEAQRVALAQDGVYGVENRLVVAKTEVAKESEPEEPVKVTAPVEAKPEVIEEVIEEKVAEVEPVEEKVADINTTEKVEPVAVVAEVVFSCQDEFKKILSSEKILFEYNRANVKTKSYKLLDSLVEVANKCPKEIVSIEGHTDSDGRKSYNKKLSLNRANAIKKYLISKGISEDRLQTVGYGESKPIVSNRTKEGKAKNRRIEFNIKGVK